MDNFFTDNSDIQWHFNHLDIEDVVASLEDGYTQASQYEDAPVSYADAIDGYRRVLEMAGAICAQEIAPLAADVDREGAHFEDGRVRHAEGTARALSVLRQAGLMGVQLPRRFGGLNFPATLYSICIEMVSQADASLMNVFGLSEAIAETICQFASDELKDKYLPLFTSGEISGAMILTEPDAGSDLQAVRLKAVPQPDGSWRLFGVKRFITNGGADVSLVLARSEEGSSDGRGLSMFLCEKCPELVIRRIENKLGIHGSPTCELQFNGVPAVLVGQRRFGLIRYVSALMNGARVGVAAQAVGIAQAAYEEALSYARNRVQYKQPIIQMPQVYDMLARMKSQIQVARAITYEANRVVDRRRMLERQLEAGPSPELKAKIRETDSYASLLTPLAKAYSTEMANRVTYDAIQIHGGAGYMKEFIVERLARDARVTSIYEGTTQLQVVAAFPLIANGTLSKYLAQLGERDFRPELMSASSALREMRERLDFCVSYLKNADDWAYSELVSRHLVDAACDAVGAHLLLNQAQRDPARELAAEKFIRDAAPRVRMHAEYVTSGNKLLIENRPALV